MFLTTQDYLPYIKEEILSQITNNQDSYRISVETAAQEEMSSYLRSRFDVAAVFMEYPILPNSNAGILTGQRYIHQVHIYESLKDTPILIGESGWESDWKMYFKRSLMAAMHLVNLCLFHLHNRINPSMIPESRTIAYENSLSWLKRIAKGEYLPEFPIVVRPEGNLESPVQYGGNVKFRTKGHGPF